MKKSGNGDALVCAENLTAIVRGEIPFDRVRGIDVRIIDKPADEASEELREDAIWNIETYEPRLDAENAEIEAVVADGDIIVQIQVTEAEEDEED